MSRVRVEIIRFALLLTMTVALISVATRHDDDSSSRNQASRGQHPATAAPSPHSGQTESPSQGGSTSSATPSAPASSAGKGSRERSGADGQAGASGSGGEPAPTLPRTGGTQAVELAALAALFIAAGSFGMRISRPRTTGVQPELLSTTVTQAGHARTSSESNRPGTA